MNNRQPWVANQIPKTHGAGYPSDAAWPAGVQPAPIHPQPAFGEGWGAPPKSASPAPPEASAGGLPPGAGPSRLDPVAGPANEAVKGVPEMLEDAAAIFRERNKEYGADYLTFGHWAVVLLSDGVSLKTADDFNRFACLVNVLNKLGRYAKNFNRGGHDDSLRDLAVYATILRNIDARIANDKDDGQ